MLENSSVMRYTVRYKSYHFSIGLFLVVTTLHSLLVSEMVQALLVKSLVIISLSFHIP
jgi:hypothetical protein